MRSLVSIILIGLSFNPAHAAEPVVTNETFAIPSTPNTTPEQLQTDLNKLRKGLPQPEVKPVAIPQPVLIPIPSRPSAPTSIIAAKPTPCVATNDISILLSPACLDTLRALGVPKGVGVPAIMPSPMSNVQMQCMVSTWAGERASSTGGGAISMISFSTPNLYSCIEAGARLSYGIPNSLSNIISIDPNQAVISVDCQRDGDGKRLSCKPQPPIVAAREEQAIPQAAVEPIQTPVQASGVEPVIQGPAPRQTTTHSSPKPSKHAKHH